MTTISFAKVFCPRCGYSFNAEVTSTGKNVGGFSGLAAGAALGAKIGIVAGPLGAIAGTIPGAILGGIFGAKAGNTFDKPQCPKCGQSFDMVQPTSIQTRQTALPSLFEELGEAAELITDLLHECEDDRDWVLEGSSTISAVIKGADERLGLTVQDGSPLQDFLSALRSKNNNELLSIIKSMAYALNQMDDRYERGMLMCYFFTGEEPD